MILNLHYHKQRLVLKALNTRPTIEQAAKALGVSDRILYVWISEMGIIRKEVYYIKEKKNESTNVQ